MNINTVIIGGALTRDPELKALPSGGMVATMSIASNRTWKDRDGNQQEDVEYHNVVIYGKQAETAGKYLTKGQTAVVFGRLKTRSWDKDGVKHYRTEIMAERVQFGPSRDGQAAAARQSKAPTSPSVVPDYPEDEINPEDIPF